MEDFPQLETQRLLLRPFRPSDGPVVERLAGMREIADTTLTIPHPYPAGGGVEWITRHPAAWARRDSLALAICAHASPDELLGAINLRLSLAHSHGEIGYWIALPRWGQGLATEAAQALVAYGFDELGLHRIQGRHFTRNAASGHVLQKLGMRQEGLHRDAYRRFGHFEDVALYAILDSEWAATRSTPSARVT
jgi:[ribosomal protein S5]-alanine N-acetyltransferase